MAEKKKASRCYTYIRVSTERQVEGYSLDSQREALKKTAKYKGWKIVKEFADEGKSGKSIAGREAFQEMLNRIKSGNPDKVDYVLVFKLSRFGRNVEQALTSLKQMRKHGVELYCSEESIDTAIGSMGYLMVTVMGAVAEIERDNIATFTMEGRRQKAREGKWNGGQAPYGYKINKEEGILEIDEEEAKIVRLIFDQYVYHQAGIHGVAKWLDDNGYRKTTRGNGKYTLFSAHTVKTIIDNPVYTGKIAYGRRHIERVEIDDETEITRRIKNDEYGLYDGKHEAIIEQSLWDDAHRKRIATGIGHEKTHSLDHEHILSGILKCPICGASMYGTVNRKKKKDGSGYYKDSWYYVCKHRKLIDGEKCTYKRQPPQDPINNEVLAILASFVDYEGNEAVMQGVMGEKTDTDAIYQRIDGLEKQKARKVAAKDRLTTQIDNLDPDDPNYDTIYDDLDERLRKIYIEIAEISKQIEDARSDLQSEADARFTQMTAREMLKAIGDKLPTMTDAHKKEICQAMLERVELFPERQEDGRYVRNVKFRFPVMERGDEKEADKWWYNENPVETIVLLQKLNS